MFLTMVGLSRVNGPGTVPDGCLNRWHLGPAKDSWVCCRGQSKRRQARQKTLQICNQQRQIGRIIVKAETHPGSSRSS